MDSDTGPKSAIELAMERLRRRDEEAGITRRPLSETQKILIAEMRKQYDAQLAELQLQKEDRLQASRDPLEFAAIEEEYRAERDRLSTERDEKLEKIRQNPHL
jgi:hypothetical protein